MPGSRVDAVRGPESSRDLASAAESSQVGSTEEPDAGEEAEVDDPDRHGFRGRAGRWTGQAEPDSRGLANRPRLRHPPAPSAKGAWASSTRPGTIG